MFSKGNIKFLLSTRWRGVIFKWTKFYPLDISPFVKCYIPPESSLAVSSSALPGACGHVLCACFFGIILLWYRVVFCSRRQELLQRLARCMSSASPSIMKFTSQAKQAQLHSAHADIYYWTEGFQYLYQWASMHLADKLLWASTLYNELIDVDAQTPMSI